MNESSTNSNTTNSFRLPSGTPKWVVILCVLVSSIVIPSFMAFSPHISRLIEEAISTRKAQAENERTALGTILELVSTNTKQIQVLSVELETQQREKKELSLRVTELEKANSTKGIALNDCLGRLEKCR